MRLQDLNDDCLGRIFSQKSLTLKDLCSLAEACILFKRLTQRIFPQEFEMKIGYYEHDYKFTSTNYSEFHESVQDVERILKNCGPNLTSLIIHRNDASVNNLISKYCDVGTLRRLEILTLKCTADLRVKFRSIYQRLLVLTIRECSVYRGVTVEQFNCDSLIELNIVNVINCSAILENTFPKLERLTFEQTGKDGRTFTRDWNRSDGRETLLSFIGRHKTLKTLHLNINFDYRMQNFAHSIVRCKQLEELTLRNFYSSEIALDCADMKDLTKLRMLDIDIGNSNYRHLVSLLNVFSGIEMLKIRTGGLFFNKDDDILSALLKLQNLRRLYLINCYFKPPNCSKLNQLWRLRFTKCSDPNYGTHILSLISQLENLADLRIDGKSEIFTLSETDLSEIAKNVDVRPNNALTLKCRFNFSENLLENCNKNRTFKIIKLN